MRKVENGGGSSCSVVMVGWTCEGWGTHIIEIKILNKLI